jgi:hypothetical protein
MSNKSSVSDQGCSCLDTLDGPSATDPIIAGRSPTPHGPARLDVVPRGLPRGVSLKSVLSVSAGGCYGAGER